MSGSVHATGEEDAVVESEKVAKFVDEKFAAPAEDKATANLQRQL